ncbi:MAG TPA: hypothetical protein VH054_17775, partial [Polyangiaceae bacterium]|nr:hypothetical protein [Polyangiaceae bacterium]
MIRQVCALGSALLLACSSSQDADVDSGADDAVADAPSPSDAGVTDAAPADAGPQIKYVMVIIKENHTFDNYFTGFPGAETTTTAKLSTGKTKTLTVAPSTDL